MLMARSMGQEDGRRPQRTVEDGRGSPHRPRAPSDLYSRHVRNPARLRRSSNLRQSELDSISGSPATRNAYPSSANEPIAMGTTAWLGKSRARPSTILYRPLPPSPPLR